MSTTSRQHTCAFGALRLKKGVLGVALAGVGFIGGFSVSAGGWGVPLARGQSPAAVDKVVQWNKKAMDDIDLADFDGAKKELLDAVSFGSKNGLESHPVMARTYIHLGALYVLGFKDKAKGQEYFGKALELQSDIKLDKNLRENKDLQKVFSSAVSAAGGTSHKSAPKAEAAAAPAPEGAGEGQAQGEDDNDPDLPANIVALDCPAKDETQPGQAVTLRCAAAPSLKIGGVAMFYKGAGMDAYEEVDMEKNAKGWWVAEVPKKRVGGKSIQFYFEGRDASGKPVVSNGRSESPLIMLVNSGGPVERTVRHEDEDPLTFGKGDNEGWGIGVLDTDYGNRRFWFGISVGSGGGFASGHLEARKTLKVSGFSFAGLGHLAPELGVMFTPNVSLAVQGRLQYIYQNELSGKVAGRGALSAIGKLSFYTAQSRNRLFFTIEGGGGEGFRFAYIKSDPSKQPNLNDTVHAGNYVAGAGAGFLHEFGPHFMWVFEVNVLGGFPDFGLVADVSTGFHFGMGSTKKKIAKDMDAASSSIDDRVDEDK
jgi:hypothetical protein